jgi:hypothetical protein
MPLSLRTKHLKAPNSAILISSAQFQNYHWIRRGLVTAVFGFTRGYFVKNLSFLEMAEETSFGLQRAALKNHFALFGHAALLVLPKAVLFNLRASTTDHPTSPRPDFDQLVSHLVAKVKGRLYPCKTTTLISACAAGTTLQ